MKNLLRKKVACRVVVIDNDEVFIVQHNSTGAVCYPGWTLDEWESLETCIRREIQEELWIDIVNPKLFLIQEVLWLEKEMLEFFYVVENNIDFRHINTQASHADEIMHSQWLPLSEADKAHPVGLNKKRQAYRETGQMQFLLFHY